MNRQTIPERDWKWFGKAGHFICGRWCRFHLTTQVGRALISTVGEYVHPMHGGGSERTEAAWLAANWPGADIRAGRKYETVVFHAGTPCKGGKCGCGQPALDPPREADFGAYNDAASATKGHMELCQKWATAEAQGAIVKHAQAVKAEAGKGA